MSSPYNINMSFFEVIEFLQNKSKWPELPEHEVILIKRMIDELEFLNNLRKEAITNLVKPENKE